MREWNAGHFKLYETYMRHKLDGSKEERADGGPDGGNYTSGEKRRPSPGQSWLSLQMNTAIEATYNINVVVLSQSCVLSQPFFSLASTRLWQPRRITIPPPYRMAILT